MHHDSEPPSRIAPSASVAAQVPAGRPQRAAASCWGCVCRAGEADSGRAMRFAPNAFIRIGARRTDRPDHAVRRDGAGHLHLDPDADRRRAGGRPRPGAARACAARRKALRQSAARRAGDGQLERDPRRLAAVARGRRDRANHAGCGCGETLERRSNHLPRARRRSAARADRTAHRVRRSSRRMRRACRYRRTWR